MKTLDFIFRCPSGHHDTLCRVRLFTNKKNQTVALLTDIGDKNPGYSVTNAVEDLRAKLIKDEYIKDDTIIIEHYEGDINGMPNDQPKFIVAKFNEKNEPRWEFINLKKALTICGTSSVELDNRLFENKDLFETAKRLRLEIYPNIDEPLIPSSESLTRRKHITSIRHSKQELISFINSSPTERELQTYIKSDLSIFGEVYGHPTDWYMSFSEFPIDSGRADFVVFTGTSRMDVYLIEIKGANFNFAGAGSYKNISAKIHEAAQQLRTKISNIRNSYGEFRLFTHGIRERVMAGESLYNSLVGPEGVEEVDENKDLIITGVVIGGRTTDDLNESKLRHEYEVVNNQLILLESWDSFIRKLTRL